MVGAIGGALEAGRAYVFKRSADGSWDIQDILNASEPALDDGFGFYVSLNSSGDTALIVAGGSGEPDNEQTETAYIFQFATVNVEIVGLSYSDWFQRAKLQLPDIVHGLRLSDYTSRTTPFSFSADGGAILTGHNYHNDNKPVYLFTGSGENWTKQELPPPADADEARFGWSVSLSANGNTALVGAPDASAVYIFTESAQPSSTPEP